MFDRVAARYDLANDVLSLGQDRAWRRLVVEAVDPRPGERMLDLAAGTGTSSEPFADAGARGVPDRPVARHARGRQAAAAPARLRRRRRAAAAVRGRRLRRGHHLLRAAQRRGHRRRAGRAAAGHPARRPAGDLRVLHPDLAAVPAGLRNYLVAALPPIARDLVATRSRTSTWPSRSRPGRTRPGWPTLIAGAGLARGRVAQPVRRHRRPAPGPSLSSAGASEPTSCSTRTRRAAARSRPRTRSTRRWPPAESEPDELAAELFDGGLTFEAEVLDRLMHACAGRWSTCALSLTEPGHSGPSACAEARRGRRPR